VEFSAVMTTNQAGLLNQVHGNSLEEIRVVRVHGCIPKRIARYDARS
jgi:hypothetical protein